MINLLAVIYAIFSTYFLAKNTTDDRDLVFVAFFAILSVVLMAFLKKGYSSSINYEKSRDKIAGGVFDTLVQMFAYILVPFVLYIFSTRGWSLEAHKIVVSGYLAAPLLFSLTSQLRGKSLREKKSPKENAEALDRSLEGGIR